MWYYVEHPPSMNVLNILCIVSSKMGGVGLMLASLGTSVKAMSLRESILLVSNVCDPSVVEVVNM
jgi:hypothetical protein